MESLACTALGTPFLHIGLFRFELLFELLNFIRAHESDDSLTNPEDTDDDASRSVLVAHETDNGEASDDNGDDVHGLECCFHT